MKSTRQQYHQRIAQTLEERFPETAESQPELLAQHYTETGLNDQAVSYWHKAGQRAIQYSANVEAVSYLTKALELLRTLPDTPERTQRELTLQLNLGVSLAATKGYGAPEVEPPYARARELCQQVGDEAPLFTVFHGLWLCYLVRGALQTAHELGEQLLRLSQATHNVTLRMEAQRAIGTSLLLRGEFVSASSHLEQGVHLYDIEQHRGLTIHYGQDSGVVCLGYAAWTLWFRGYPEQALHCIDEALTLAQQLTHPYSLGFALTFAAWLHQWCREPQTVLGEVEASIALAHEHEFPLLLAHGMTSQGWALVEQDQVEVGIEQIRRGLAAYRATGTELAQPYLLTLLAHALRKGGKIEEGLAVLTEALTRMDKNEERWCDAELHRLQGEFLLHLSSDNHTEAETCFHQALFVSRSQQAKSWELRAATSLAKLWQQQDKRKEAYNLLAPVYDWFTEGFDTLDLKDAKTLLDELS